VTEYQLRLNLTRTKWSLIFVDYSIMSSRSYVSSTHTCMFQHSNFLLTLSMLCSRCALCGRRLLYSWGTEFEKDEEHLIDSCDKKVCPLVYLTTNLVHLFEFVGLSNNSMQLFKLPLNVLFICCLENMPSFLEKCQILLLMTYFIALRSPYFPLYLHKSVHWGFPISFSALNSCSFVHIMSKNPLEYRQSCPLFIISI